MDADFGVHDLESLVFWFGEARLEGVIRNLSLSVMHRPLRYAARCARIDLAVNV